MLDERRSLMGKEDARLQSKSIILILLPVQGTPVESVTVLLFAESLFGRVGLYPHSPPFQIYLHFSIIL